MHFRPTDGGMFLAVPETAARRACCGGSIPRSIHAELMVQLAAFKDLFGRAPDFVDGHQHVQLFPQVRDAFLRAVKEDRTRRVGPAGRTQPAARTTARRAQGAGARYSQRAIPQTRRARRTSRSIRRLPAPMIFRTRPISASLMRQFLDGLPDGGLVMCHPGFCRRHAGQPRSPDHPARGRTRAIWQARHLPRCWRRTKLH